MQTLTQGSSPNVKKYAQPAAAGGQALSPATRALLAAGAASGPLFYGLAAIQMAIRPGFDIRRHAISLLSLGDLGWIQIASFILTGVLALLCAVALRRVLRGGKAGTWGPLLIGVYGVGLIIGGLFHPDPGLGFPPGAPAGMPTSMSAQAGVHSLAFYLAFLSLIAASFVIARRFAAEGRGAWRAYSLATGIVAPVLIVLGSTNPGVAGMLFAVAGLVAFGWASAVAAYLARHPF